MPIEDNKDNEKSLMMIGTKKVTHYFLGLIIRMTIMMIIIMMMREDKKI